MRIGICAPKCRFSLFVFLQSNLQVPPSCHVPPTSSLRGTLNKFCCFLCWELGGGGGNPLFGVGGTPTSLNMPNQVPYMSCLFFFYRWGRLNLSVLSGDVRLILLSRQPPETRGKRIGFSKRTMVEKNGETTPRAWGAPSGDISVTRGFGPQLFRGEPELRVQEPRGRCRNLRKKSRGLGLGTGSPPV